MTVDVDSEHVHAETRSHWRDWLERNHAHHSGVWLVSWKKHTGKARMTYDEAVEEALAFGWIDSKPSKVDDERTALWFAPRKPQSSWSRINKERIARLEDQGRMADAGRRAVDAAKANGAWTRLDDVEKLVVPGDLVAALASHDQARENWDTFPRSVRRGILEWIVLAKRESTRARRVEQTALLAARGERANQWRRT